MRCKLSTLLIVRSLFFLFALVQFQEIKRRDKNPLNLLSNTQAEKVGNPNT
jgi:hypothetical protein